MSLRIVFMGTPEFSIPSLQILLENGYDVVGVITATDKMGGRGKKRLLESPVKTFALKKGLRVLQPGNLKHPEFISELRNLRADLQIVVAFRMLPVVVWDMPPMGTLNLHGSLLPKYRGAAPINWAIIRGEKITGVTTFLLKHAIDTGDLLLSEEIPIGPEDTAGDLHDKMKWTGAQVVLKTVKLLEAGDITPVPQDDRNVSNAPKLTHEMCEIDFQNTVSGIHNFIRGLSPFPGAWTMIDGKSCKILRAKPEIITHRKNAAEIETDQKTYIRIYAPEGYIEVKELQLEGKRRMKTEDFLNGYTLRSLQAGSA